MVSLPPGDLDWARQFIDSAKWKEAKDQRSPHAYTLREWVNDDEAFERFVCLIRSFGTPEKFFKYARPYLHLDGLKYWTMGDTIERTIVINRADQDLYYGRQNAHQINPELPQTVYDTLAPRYDARYETRECLRENDILFAALRDELSGSVVDIGCGTGLLLDYIKIPAREYVGLDPSQGMLNEFIRKHPSYRVDHATFEEWWSPATFDVAVSLFGSPSYIEPAEYSRLQSVAWRYFFMFYVPGYQPDYDPENATKTDYLGLDLTFGTVYDWQKYRIVTNMDVHLEQP